jgi:hypothetical protein
MEAEKKKPGPKPKGGVSMSGTERMRAYRLRLQAEGAELINARILKETKAKIEARMKPGLTIGQVIDEAFRRLK